jgi:hypothetical protein
MNLILEVVDSRNLPSGHPMAGLIQPEDRRADLTGSSRLAALEDPSPLRPDYTRLTGVSLLPPTALVPAPVLHEDTTAKKSAVSPAATTPDKPEGEQQGPVQVAETPKLTPPPA